MEERIPVSRHLTVIAVLIGALLTGCGPRYQTFTSYSPPQDDAGRQCAAQCSSTRQMCRQSGQALIQQCRIQAQTEAQLENLHRLAEYHAELERYRGNGQSAPERPGTASPDYGRCDGEGASVEQQCKADFDLCYQSCGGQVAYTTHCVANCE
jgi:hypothetical protein